MVDLVELESFNCKQQRVRAVRFNVDGSYCLTCGADKKINLWNPYKKKLLKTYGGHALDVLDAAGSCESSHIISASADKSVIYWDVTTAQPLRRYRTHAGSVTCVKLNEESTMAISGSVDNTVMLWDLMSRRMEPVQILKGARDTVTSIVVTDHEILTSSVDCHLRLYDLRTCKMTTDLIGKVVTCVKMTNDGQCYVISCENDEIKLFDKDSGEQLSTYTGHKMNDYMIENAINHKDSHIISGSASGEIFVWDLISGTCVTRIPHSPNRVVSSISHHPNDNYLLSACDDNVKLWGPKPPESMDE